MMRIAVEVDEEDDLGENSVEVVKIMSVPTPFKQASLSLRETAAFTEKASVIEEVKKPSKPVTPKPREPPKEK